MKRQSLVFALLTMVSMMSMAQSCDAEYPVGSWQSPNVKVDYLDEFIIVDPPGGKRNACPCSTLAF